MLTVIRRIVCAAVALVVCVIISGCGGEKMTAMEKVQKMLTEYECSKTDATIQRFSNKGENTYETTQYSKITGEYRMEIKSPEAMNGNYTVFDRPVFLRGAYFAVHKRLDLNFEQPYCQYFAI